MILKEVKRIEKDIFINTGKIELVWVIGIWNLRFVWNLMLGIWDFKNSVNVYNYFAIKSTKFFERRYSYGFCNYCCCWQRCQDE